MENTPLPKRLTLSENKLFLGVVAGIAEYFDFDVALARILFALFLVVTGFFPGVVFYFIAYIIMHDSSRR